MWVKSIQTHCGILAERGRPEAGAEEELPGEAGNPGGTDGDSMTPYMIISDFK